MRDKILFRLSQEPLTKFISIKSVLLFILVLQCRFTSLGQTQKLFPYQSFLTVRVYQLDLTRIEEIDKQYRSSIMPGTLVNEEKNEVSAYFPYHSTLSSDQCKRLLRLINTRKNYYLGECATVFLDNGFVFYDSNEKIVGTIEVSLDCYEVFFTPENHKARGQLDDKAEKELIEFMIELKLLKPGWAKGYPPSK